LPSLSCSRRSSCTQTADTRSRGRPRPTCGDHRPPRFARLAVAGARRRLRSLSAAVPSDREVAARRPVRHSANRPVSICLPAG
jgi:hypothetical protein